MSRKLDKDKVREMRKALITWVIEVDKFMGHYCDGVFDNNFPKISGKRIPKRDKPDVELILTILTGKMGNSLKKMTTKMYCDDPNVDKWQPWQLAPFVEIEEVCTLVHKVQPVVTSTLPIYKVLRNKFHYIAKALIEFEKNTTSQNY